MKNSNEALIDQIYLKDVSCVVSRDEHESNLKRAK
jgi:hypothetical protein